MHRTKVCAEEKLHTVLDILAGKESVSHAVARLSVNKSSVQGWITSYKGNGVDAFMHTQNKPYSIECKIQAVTAYLNKEGSFLLSAKNSAYVQTNNYAIGLRSIMVMRS